MWLWAAVIPLVAISPTKIVHRKWQCVKSYNGFCIEAAKCQTYESVAQDLQASNASGGWVTHGQREAAADLSLHGDSSQ